VVAVADDQTTDPGGHGDRLEEPTGGRIVVRPERAPAAAPALTAAVSARA
jgi:hypothetical protein